MHTYYTRFDEREKYLTPRRGEKPCSCRSHCYNCDTCGITSYHQYCSECKNCYTRYRNRVDKFTGRSILSNDFRGLCEHCDPRIDQSQIKINNSRHYPVIYPQVIPLKERLEKNIIALNSILRQKKLNSIETENDENDENDENHENHENAENAEIANLIDNLKGHDYMIEDILNMVYGVEKSPDGKSKSKKRKSTKSKSKKRKSAKSKSVFIKTE